MHSNQCNLKNYISKSEDCIDIFIELLKMNKAEDVVGMITLDYHDRVNSVVELMRGDNAFKKIGTDDLFNKAFMLDAFSIILAHNSPHKTNDLDDEYYNFNDFLLNESEKMQMEVRDHLIILDRDDWISIR